MSHLYIPPPLLVFILSTPVLQGTGITLSVTRQGLEDPGFKSWQGKKFVCSSKHPGPQYPVKWAPVFFSGVTWQRRVVDHSPTSSVEVKNKWSYTSVSTVCLHGVDRENIDPSYLHTYFI
jgi:hypothetical protein